MVQANNNIHEEINLVSCLKSQKGLQGSGSDIIFEQVNCVPADHHLHLQTQHWRILHVFIYGYYNHSDHIT